MTGVQTCALPISVCLMVTHQVRTPDGPRSVGIPAENTAQLWGWSPAGLPCTKPQAKGLEGDHSNQWTIPKSLQFVRESLARFQFEKRAFLVSFSAGKSLLPKTLMPKNLDSLCTDAETKYGDGVLEE